MRFTTWNSYFNFTINLIIYLAFIIQILILSWVLTVIVHLIRNKHHYVFNFEKQNNQKTIYELIQKSLIYIYVTTQPIIFETTQKNVFVLNRSFAGPALIPR